MSQYDLKVEYYSEKCIVVRGEDTTKAKEHLLSMGGKYNSRLRGGPGWIFPKTKEIIVRDFTDDGKIPKAQEYRKSSSYQNTGSTDSRLHAKVDKLSNDLKKMSLKLEKLITRVLTHVDPDEDGLIIVDDSEEESSDDEPPMPRLLK
jgi:hypothetical protein